jgi:hypothetical protein
MVGIHEQGATALQAVSAAMVTLHKEQFGRGPTTSRANFAPRTAFQAATASDFIRRVEEILIAR